MLLCRTKFEAKPSMVPTPGDLAIENISPLRFQKTSN